MIATSDVIQAAAESLPSEPPSERDLQIFAAVKVDARRQVDVGAEFGISQSRVSQIVSHVQKWRIGMGVGDDLERRDRKQLDAWLDAQRLESLYEHTLELFRSSCQPRRRERKGTDQHGEWQDETIDHLPGNLQCLRLAARLIELRWKMEEKCPQPSAHALALADESTFFHRLISMRAWAEHRGEVPRGEPAGDMLKRFLDVFLGRNRKSDAANGNQEPTTRSEEPKAGIEQPATSPQPAYDAAHTAHIMSAAPVAYEPAEECDVNDCEHTTCIDYSAASPAAGQAANDDEEMQAIMSGGLAEQPCASTTGRSSESPEAAATANRKRPTRRSLAEQEQLALVELRSAFGEEIWPELANHSVPNLLAKGQANLMLQGYTREQRHALLGWQRVMERRRESEVGGRKSEVESRNRFSELET